MLTVEDEYISRIYSLLTLIDATRDAFSLQANVLWESGACNSIKSEVGRYPPHKKNKQKVNGAAEKKNIIMNNAWLISIYNL